VDGREQIGACLTDQKYYLPLSEFEPYAKGQTTCICTPLRSKKVPLLQTFRYLRCIEVSLGRASMRKDLCKTASTQIKIQGVPGFLPE
jgi:hypothetical protein